MKAKKIIGLLVAVALVAGIAVGIAAIVRDKRITELRNRAANLCRQGQYEESKAIFSQFDDDVAQSWVKKCDQGIADQEAQALLDAGKPEAALALLNEANPDSELIPDAALARAKQLVAQDDPEAALALLQGVPESREIERYLPECKLAADEKRFQALLDAGSLSEAQEILQANQYTLDDAQKAEWRLAYDRANAAELLKQGQLFSAFKRYEELSDESGMAAALEAMEAEGEYLTAFRCVAEMDEPDAARLDALYDRLIETGFTPVNDYGRLEQHNLQIGSLLARLLAMDGDAPAALASRIADGIVGECRSMIDEGRRSVPYYALSELSQLAAALWTEDLEALKNGCLEEMPESRVWRDPDGLQVLNGSSVTVHTGARAAMFMLTRLTDPDPIYNKCASTGKTIYVFIRPRSQYTFSVSPGYYNASVWMSENWFGDKETLGVRAVSSSVEINNGYHTYQQGKRLSGSYSITLE